MSTITLLCAPFIITDLLVLIIGVVCTSFSILSHLNLEEFLISLISLIPFSVLSDMHLKFEFCIVILFRKIGNCRT